MTQLTKEQANKIKNQILHQMTVAILLTKKKKQREESDRANISNDNCRIKVG
mgnify:CR=1 FL=1